MTAQVSAERQNEIEAVARQMGDNREAILSSLWHREASSRPQLNTAEIRRRADLPAGSMDHYLTHLEELGLVSLVGRENEGGGNPARVWELTDRGEEYMEVDPRGVSRDDVHPARVRRLEHRIEELEEEVATTREALQEMRDVLL